MKGVYRKILIWRTEDCRRRYESEGLWTWWFVRKVVFLEITGFCGKQCYCYGMGILKSVVEKEEGGET